MTATFDEHRSTWAAILLLIGLFGLAAITLAVDDRLIEGASVWAKPMKFAGSFALHLATLAILVRLVAPERRGGRWALGLLGAASAGALVEVFYVYLQSARGRASHFNFETELETALYYQVMGGAALVIMLATIGIGVLIVRYPDPTAGAGLRFGAASGLIAGSIATLVTAGARASGELTETARWIGGSLSHADGLPVVGWSTTGGDLRAPHFFATHVVQALPVVGLLADRIAPASARPIVVSALIAALAIVCATLVQALSGNPLLPLDVTT